MVLKCVFTADYSEYYFAATNMNEALQFRTRILNSLLITKIETSLTKCFLVTDTMSLSLAEVFCLQCHKYYCDATIAYERLSSLPIGRLLSTFYYFRCLLSCDVILSSYLFYKRTSFDATLVCAAIIS